MDGRPLTNTVGAVLDPIFSLRTRKSAFPLPEQPSIVTFTTLSRSRQAAEDLAKNTTTWRGMGPRVGFGLDARPMCNCITADQA